MGKVEELFAAGVAAFEAGEPRVESREFDWKCGWDSALEGKKQQFLSYHKVRRLHQQDFRSSVWSESTMDMIRASRIRRIAQFEEQYPDFKEAYDALQT